MLEKIKHQMLAAEKSQKGLYFTNMKNLIKEIKEEQAFPKALEQLRILLDGQNVFEKLAEEQGCTGVNLTLTGTNSSQQDEQIKRTLEQCPQLEGKAGTISSALMQSAESGSLMIVDGVSFVALITFGVMLALGAGAALAFSMNCPQTGSFLRLGAGVCFVALAFELAILCSLHLSPYTCKAIGQALGALR